MSDMVTSAGRVATVFCVVTTIAMGIFVATLGIGGFLAPNRIDAAVRGMRGEVPQAEPVKASSASAATTTTPGDIRELETLVVMAEARDRDLRAQADKVRAERRVSEKAAEDKKTPPTTVSTATRVLAAETVPSNGERFKANLDILRNHVPKTAATLMADWETTEIVGYLKAMKPYEAADIVGAMLAMGRKGETDYVVKAKAVQAALGK